MVIARTLGRQLREVHGAVIKQELPPELQRVIDHLHEGAVKRPPADHHPAMNGLLVTMVR